jgi:hypothetical protein
MKTSAEERIARLYEADAMERRINPLWDYYPFHQALEREGSDFDIFKHDWMDYETVEEMPSAYRKAILSAEDSLKKGVSPRPPAQLAAAA